MDKKYRIITILIALMSFCAFFFVFGVFIGRAWQFQIDKERKLNEIADRISVAADWQAVRDHVYCEIGGLGNSRTTILDQLNEIGPMTLNENGGFTNAELVIFHDQITRRELADLFLWFDDNGFLIKREIHYGGPETITPICP